MAKERYKVLRVTMTIDYLVPMYDGKHSKIDGLTIPQVIGEWFGSKDWPLSRHHAARDGHAIGNSEQLVKVEVLRKSKEPKLIGS